MVSEHLEIERKYDVDADHAPPTPADLAALPGVAAVDEPVEHLLEAAYFDTADLRLVRGRVTLRRRTGGPDAGWHLKLPAEGGARRELHAPLGRSTRKPPRELLDPLAGLLRGAPVQSIATLRTRRVVTALRDADGRVLAELADDTVTATVPAPTPDRPLEVQTWREIEVELMEGEESLLAAVEQRLVVAGAHPSSQVSKIGRVMASRNAGPSPADGSRREPRAGDVVVEALRIQVAALQAADVALRTEQPGALRRMRVAARRLRSLLAAFAPLLERTTVDALRRELSWLRDRLAAARDGEVALSRLRAVVADEPEELVLGPVAARLQQTALQAAAEGRGRALESLTDPRYLALLDALHDLLDRPPLLDRAARPVRPALRAALRRSARRVQRRLERVGSAGEGGRDEALHDLRTAAKRLRDVAEMATPELGRPAKVLGRAMKRLQRVLGERQDTVATRDHCRRLAVVAHAAGESTFAYGRLHALEEFRAERAERAFEALEPHLRPDLAAATRKR